jgi:hypothetical protein
VAILDAVAKFVGRSVYQGKTPSVGADIESRAVIKIREILGGNLNAPPWTQLEWYLEEVDEAREAADRGDLTQVGRLLRALRGDAVISGLQRSKAGGCIRLPKKWRGNPEIVEELTSADIGSISNWDLLCPPSEVQAMVEDADFLRVAIGELVPVQGRPFRVLRRLDPEFLFYNWALGRWYYRSNAALLDVEPGDGRWVLHLAGPATAPWQFGNWLSLGRTWVRKDAAQHLKSNWEFHLANAARVAVSPQAAGTEQRQSLFRQVMAWGINTVFSLPQGYDVKLLESNGRGWEGFDTSIKAYNEELMIAIAGQLVSITGGTGFSSEDLYANVRYDLIRDTVLPWAFTASTQIIPSYVFDMHGEDALDDCPSYEYVVQRPDDLKSEAAVYTALGQGLEQIERVAAKYGLELEMAALLRRFGIETRQSKRQPQVKLDLAPTDIAKCVTVDEVRASQGLPALGGDRGGTLISELEGKTPETIDTEGEEVKPGLKAVA